MYLKSDFGNSWNEKLDYRVHLLSGREMSQDLTEKCCSFVERNVPIVTKTLLHHLHWKTIKGLTLVKDHMLAKYVIRDLHSQLQEITTKRFTLVKNPFPVPILRKDSHNQAI